MKQDAGAEKPKAAQRPALATMPTAMTRREPMRSATPPQMNCPMA
jgi:hypothetical protein